MINHIKNVKLLLFATACLLIVCVLDFLSPPDSVVGILYVFALILVRQESVKTILIFLIVASLMNIINFVVFAANATALYWLYLINALIIMVCLCLLTLVILKYKKAKELYKVKGADKYDQKLEN